MVRAKRGAWEADCVISRKPVRRASIQRDCLALWTNLRSPSNTIPRALFCTIDKLLPAKSIPPLCSSPAVNQRSPFLFYYVDFDYATDYVISTRLIFTRIKLLSYIIIRTSRISMYVFNIYL